MARSRWPGAPPGIEASSPRVYGWPGSRKIVRTGPSSTMRPAYMTATRSAVLGDDAEVVGDEQQRQVERRLHLAQQVENLRLDRHVERRRRFVGDDERGTAGERHRDQHALPHPA